MAQMVLALFFSLYVDFYRTFINRRCVLVPFPFGLYLKTGLDLYGPEADTIRFISSNSGIPVPRVIASARGGGYQYMLMTRVQGVNLHQAWETLSSQDRSNIVSQLRKFIAEQRALRPPPCVPEGAVCSLYNQPLHDHRVASVKPCGPFTSEAAFNDFLVEEGKEFVWQPEVLLDIRRRMRDDHRIVFTHGDLSPRNVLVHGSKVTAIVDWEDAGWYPEHWELIKAEWCPGICDPAWSQAIRDIISDEYEEELLVDRLISDHMEGAIRPGVSHTPKV